MPIYDYVCNKCKEKCECIILNRQNEVKCKQCGSSDMKRLFPVNGHFRLKGSGWYGRGSK